MKKFLILAALFVAAVSLSSCGSDPTNIRINLKDGDNKNNENGFGRFNEQNSPALCKSYGNTFSVNAVAYIGGFGMGILGENYRRNGHSDVWRDFYSKSNIEGFIENNAVTYLVIQGQTPPGPRPYVYIDQGAFSNGKHFAWRGEIVPGLSSVISRVTGSDPVNVDVKVRTAPAVFKSVPNFHIELPIILDGVLLPN
jgi:hypothetical protein